MESAVLTIRKSVFTGIVLSVFTLTGCAHVHIPSFWKSSPQTEEAVDSKPQKKQKFIKNAYVSEGQIVAPRELERGRKIAVIPFYPGPGVEAGGAAEKAALMIVKGISDVLDDPYDGQEPYFKITTAKTAGDADLVISGHINRMARSSTVGRWVLFKTKTVLSVSGRVSVAKTADPVIIFEEVEELRRCDDDYQQLGYQVGKNIGELIRSGILE